MAPIQTHQRRRRSGRASRQSGGSRGAGANMPTWGEKLEAYRRLQQKTHLAVGFPGLARPPAGGLV